MTASRTVRLGQRIQGTVHGTSAQGPLIVELRQRRVLHSRIAAGRANGGTLVSGRRSWLVLGLWSRRLASAVGGLAMKPLNPAAKRTCASYACWSVYLERWATPWSV